MPRNSNIYVEIYHFKPLSYVSFNHYKVCIMLIYQMRKLKLDKMTYSNKITKQFKELHPTDLSHIPSNSLLSVTQ